MSEPTAIHRELQEIGAQLEAIAERARNFERSYAGELAAVRPEFRDSARNLVHYLGLRDEDLRELQERLACLGLSSLGRAERSVMASIRAVQRALADMSGAPAGPPGDAPGDLHLRNPDARSHKRAIFGEDTDGRNVSIMVTLPTRAAGDCALVAGMIDAGMDIARINFGHDRRDIWTGMVENVRKASRDTGKACRIAMDLSGPKLRTGDMLPGPKVLHIRPRRDPLGRVIAPRRVRIVADDAPRFRRKRQVVPVPRECIEFAAVGDTIRLKDARGKKRKLKIVRKDPDGLVVESYKGVYIVTGAKLRLLRAETSERITYRVGDLPAIERPILLRRADTLVLHREKTPGEPAVEDADGHVTHAAHIACQQPEVFGFVSPGEPIWLNDGKIGGVVKSVSAERLEIEITKAKATGSKLRGNRGINFPDSNIRLPGLTATDKANLDYVVAHADAVCQSFVREPADIESLQEELGKYPDQRLGLIIKIETERAFEHLPRLLLVAMRSYPAAVMIARGDLAVECGWERLAELQEEILWLCEAAQLPVIWATEVLAREAKKGQPSRAEITDAAMSQRADCVMLNKGPHILATIRMLDDILRRMQDHQFKKTARLRKLSIATARP